ncbi:interferon-induced protein with tetratricopeptide repeats 5-like [Grus japonensis]|uniref:Interferon-induced protein with tetratricopeptide repeats 5-like n=1 Tax=Grus japonensis TaxID=30415 RepID=A0ABC9WTW9_GRUJA
MAEAWRLEEDEEELRELGRRHRRVALSSAAVNEGSDRAALVGTWPPARVNPPHHLFARRYSGKQHKDSYQSILKAWVKNIT